jgi:valyl-tRNA synthetase
MEQVQFHIALDLLQRFYWHDVCDQYVEALKPRLYSPKTKESQMAAENTLYHVIWTFSRLLAPFCPHITEEIYQTVLRGREGGISIHSAKYPEPNDTPDVDGRAGGIIIDVISGLRTKKVNAKVALSAEVPKALVQGDAETVRLCRENEWLIREVLHIRELEFGEGEFRAELVLA